MKLYFFQKGGSGYGRSGPKRNTHMGNFYFFQAGSQKVAYTVL